MSRKGNPYDNATAESFFKTLKAVEEVYLWEYQTLRDVQERIPYFLEAVYNWVIFPRRSLRNDLISKNKISRPGQVILT